MDVPCLTYNSRWERLSCWSVWGWGSARPCPCWSASQPQTTDWREAELLSVQHTTLLILHPNPNTRVFYLRGVPCLELFIFSVERLQLSGLVKLVVSFNNIYDYSLALLDTGAVLHRDRGHTVQLRGRAGLCLEFGMILKENEIISLHTDQLIQIKLWKPLSPTHQNSSPLWLQF